MSVITHQWQNQLETDGMIFRSLNVIDSSDSSEPRGSTSIRIVNVFIFIIKKPIIFLYYMNTLKKVYKTLQSVKRAIRCVPCAGLTNLFDFYEILQINIQRNDMKNILEVIITFRSGFLSMINDYSGSCSAQVRRTYSIFTRFLHINIQQNDMKSILEVIITFRIQYLLAKLNLAVNSHHSIFYSRCT